MEASVLIRPTARDLTVIGGANPACRIGFITIDAELDTQEAMATKWLREVLRTKAERAQAAAPFRMRPQSWSANPDLDPDQVRDEIADGDRVAPLGWIGDAS